MEVLRLGISQTKTICQEISLTFQTEMQWLLTIRTGGIMEGLMIYPGGILPAALIMQTII